MKRQAEQFKRFKQLIDEVNNLKLNSACEDQSKSATPGKAKSKSKLINGRPRAKAKDI